MHARRGVKVEIMLMLTRCAPRDRRIGCALLGHVSTALSHLYQVPRPLPVAPSLLLPMAHTCMMYASSRARSLLLSLAQEVVPARSSLILACA